MCAGNMSMWIRVPPMLDNVTIQHVFCLHRQP